MTSTKRALIIASPFGGLSGPLNDAESMKRVLQKWGFEIFECYNSAATRQGILDAWQGLIAATSDGDAVVIYHTGHGNIVRPRDSHGHVTSDEEEEEVDAQSGKKLGSSPFQILVPMDYDQTTDTDFRGILNLVLNASIGGAGIDISTTTFTGPATKKILAVKDTPGCEGVFPLWTLREGFGVISVFRGPEKTLFIENDRVPLGATAYFRNVPDLYIVECGDNHARYRALDNLQTVGAKVTGLLLIGSPVLAPVFFLGRDSQNQLIIGAAVQ
ncbi:uncharacterized protein BJX67DRAFT_384945 [Aspergillus lucknowensis]|uniref:Peptidase C14 caspase domain-containing protein n=1 Tax=Aspergillus lucknowensis TaxID=176173 RepID=A0ABR4LII7_9EURO